MVRHADRIIAVSRDLQHYFQTTHGVAADYIPNGVARVRDDVPADAGLLAEFGLESGRYLICVGRLVPEKRLEDLLAAYRRIETTMQLAVVGEGLFAADHVKRLRDLAADDPRVVFTGAQHDVRLEALFRGAALYVHPSELEGLPMSVLECMAYGVPPILSDIPPHRELVDGLADYDMLFPPRDPEALAERMARALADPERMRRLGDAARARVRREHDWGAVADRTEGVLRDAVVHWQQPTAIPARVSLRRSAGHRR
jgi:glycosyltransferase involved in cell wall biosynthesis